MSDHRSGGAQLRHALSAERDRVTRQVADLERDVQATIDASAGTNADDEHDPEGSTIGFERAQVASLLARARTRLADLDRAQSRLAAGTCREPIAAERVEAHPTAATCVRCASGPATRRIIPG